MKYKPDHKAARAILEAILKELPTLPEEAAADIALAAYDKYTRAGGNITEPSLAFLVGPAAAKPDAGRPEPGQKTWADLLKEPAEASRIEDIIREHVKIPPDLAALAEALRRLKKLSQTAANKADIWRATRAIIGDRAGTQKGFAENLNRAANKSPKGDGKINRKIEEYITILSQ